MLSRLCDTHKVYGPVKKKLIKFIDSKYQIEQMSRQSWPVYASYEEDKELMKNKWGMEYKNEQIVMWDMTNINAYGFSDADLQ